MDPIADPSLVRQRLREERTRLREAYRAQPEPRILFRAHVHLIDKTLIDLWKASGLSRALCLAAVGGYGRGELYPASDVDLLVLLPDNPSQVDRDRIETYLRFLWDAGLDIGHAVRTVDECIEASAGDLTIQTNLLETRFLAGHRPLHRRLVEAFAATLDPRAFAKGKLLEQRLRHERFQDTNLEPNIKEFSGGLRDLHHLLWISRASGLGSSWSALVSSGIVTSAEARGLSRLHKQLADLRIRLHFLAGRREDRLVFDHQGALAREYGLTDVPGHRASEILMSRVYARANAVRQINTIVQQNVHSRIFPPRERAIEPVNDRFVIRDQLLEATREDLFEQCPAAILESFNLLQDHNELQGMRAGTLRALWRARGRINAAFRRDQENRERFMKILRHPARLVRELRRMNQYGILGRYIPEFGRVVGQMQHDLYHVYTVDEHILKVVRNVRRFAVAELAHEYPLCSRLINDFARPEVLYLAALFHDIAKGRGGDHSTLGARDARRFCRAHGLAREDVELVGWLVESHLLMSATAQKQDISDPSVVAAFTAQVKTDRRLVAIYLLTVADIRGTSPKVWNGWKAKLLEDLFWSARRELAGEQISTESSVQKRQEEALATLRLYAIPTGAQEKLWAQLDTSYFLRHDSAEIAWHTRLLNYRVDSSAPVVKARPAPMGEGLQVMVYTPDQRELFARICGFFSRISFNIVEAKIHTTRHGYALDSFLVLDPNGESGPYRDLTSFLEHELAQRLRHPGELDAPSAPRLSRRARHFPIDPEVNIAPDERGAYKVLTIIASDRPGLLYRIALVLVAFDVSLHSAKVNTLGERAEDVFLITGAALDDARTVVRLEAQLLAALQTG